MKRQRPLNEDNLDEDFVDEQEDNQNQLDAAFQQKLLGEPADVESLLQKLKNKKIQNEFGRDRPATFLAVLEKLLSLEIQDEKQEAARYQALEGLAKIKMPRITKPGANYFLYCIGIKYAHRFSQHRELQAAFFGKMSAIKKGGEAILAAMQGNLQALEKLSLDYAKTHETKFPPLSLFATANNQPEVLRLLHRRGKPLRSHYMRLDPLFHAVAHGLNDLIPLFFECLQLIPGNYHVENSFGPSFISSEQYCLRSNTPNFLLGTAAAHGQLETVKVLQGRGFKDSWLQGIITAANNKHFHIVELLLSEIPSQENWDHISIPSSIFELLRHLVIEKQEILLQRLLKTFHKPLVVEGSTSATPLQYLLDTAIEKDHLDAFIWAGGAPVEFRGINFQKALLNGSVSILTYFVTMLIPEENRPSTIYDQLRQIRVIDSQLPHFKKSLEHLRLAQLGFDFNFQDAQGFTLLMQYAGKGIVPGIELLIELGADPWVRNQKNESAFDLCWGIDAAMALLKWKPAENVEGEPRPYPFSFEKIKHLFRIAINSSDQTKNRDQFLPDFKNIMRISLRLIEEKLVLLEKAAPNSLSAKEFYFDTHYFSKMKGYEDTKEIFEPVESKATLLKLRYNLKKLEWDITHLKSLSKDPTIDEEQQTQAKKQVFKHLLAGIVVNPLLFGEELRKLFQDYIYSKELESIEILLAFILSLEESGVKSIVCRSLGEALWAFNKYHAYLCCREAGKNDENEALRATMILIELMGVDAAWNISQQNLETQYPKEYAQVMAKIEEENKKFTLRCSSANANKSLLIHSANEGNLQIVRALFEQGQLSFETFGSELLRACSRTASCGHYEILSYLTVNAVNSLLKRKLYRSDDFKASSELLKYLIRPFISETCMSDEALRQMQSSLAQKHELNTLISGILDNFAPRALLSPSLPIDDLLKNISILENYICNGYETSFFQERVSPDFLPLLNAVLVLAYHDNSAHQGNPSLQNIITFLIGNLAINRENIGFAILLNECTQDKTLKIRRRLDLFNGFSKTNYKSLEEFQQTDPLKLLSLNLYVRALWCNLLGRENGKPGELILLGNALDNSARFLEQYSSMKNRTDQFQDELPRLCHRYELFSRLESACMLEFMKIQEKSLEALRKPADTGDLLEQSSPRASSSPRLFRSRSSEDFEGAKRLPSADLIPPDNSKQQKL